MTFLNPLVLLSLAAASIPLLLHLLNLRKLRSVDFSTLQFLKELQKTKIRRLKLKQIILLILRTLIVIFAVLAFSRPVIKTSLPALGSHVKSSVVILVDNSFSMEASDGSGNRLKQARSAALSVVAALKDGDEAAVLPLVNTANGPNLSLSRNFELLREEIGLLKTGYAAASLEDGFRIAQKILQSSANLNKEVYLITDAQKNIFTRQQSDSLHLFDDRTAIFVAPIGSSEVPDLNLTIDTVNVISRIFALDKPVEVEATIRNTSKRDAKGAIIGLNFDGQRVAQRSADIPSGEVRTIALAASPHKPGLVKASIELEPDALEPDNTRYFGFIISDKPKVAIFGDERQTQFLSLLFTAQKTAANANIFPAAALGAAAAQNYDVIITSCAISNSDAARIEEFARDGGGALIFANENHSDVYSTFGLSAIGVQSFDKTNPAQITSVDKLHPLFEGVFKSSTDAKLVVESPKILKAIPVIGGQSIISMGGGAFLAEQRKGDGRLLFCAVAPTAEWGNFPMTGLFPTLVVRSISYLSARESFSGQIAAGGQATIQLPKRYATGGNCKLVDPSGVESYRQTAALPGGATLTLDALSRPGVYGIYTPENKPIAAVAVNPYASEGKLIFADKGEISGLIHRYTAEHTPVEIITDATAVAEGVARARIGSELWKTCVIAALLCAIAETLIARATRAEMNA